MFIASRSRDSPGCRTPLTDSQTQDTSPRHTIPVDGNLPSRDRESDLTCYPENNRVITALARQLGALRRDVTQLRSDIVNLKSTSNNETCGEICCIYVRLKSIKLDDLCESFLGSILQCPIICLSIILVGLCYHSE